MRRINMEDHLMDTPFTNKEPSTAPGGNIIESLSPASLQPNPMCCEMGLPLLAAHCLRELDNYHQGEPCIDAYGLELLHRALIQSDQEARTWVQHCFVGMVRDWLHRHPKREMVYRLESEENYVAQTFERFWEEAIHTQERAIGSLAVALRHLRANLNGVLLEKLRVFSELGESSSILDPYEAEESLVEKRVTGSEVWAVIQGILLDARKQRLAYLLFYCGLSPKEVLCCCSSEFDDLSEISHLRYTIMEHLLRHTDQLPSSISFSN
jgi:hypothetical protein